MNATIDKDFADEIDEIVEVLKALSNPIRLKILALCLKKERCSRDLRETLKISKPLLITHLRKLVNAGFLSFRIEIDEERIIIRKYYKTKDIEIHIGKKLLNEIANEIESA
jgi:DNA-binding transcriptional ArsR family regulator